MTILVTGCAGFIGFHVAKALLARGDTVLGIDDLNPYYDVRLKAARLARLSGLSGFHFQRADIAEPGMIATAAAAHPGIERIVHLAAQAGVRYSLEAPRQYIHANIAGYLEVLEFARNLGTCRHLVYASSSSVYGASAALPFDEADRADQPLSLYAATKRANELMAHAYAHLFGVPATGLRFFTVYGPWGRPDMAYFTFARAILEGRPITVYDHGRPRRDFTYIDDIVAGVIGCLDRPPAAGDMPRLLNIGNHRAETVGRLIGLLEAALGRRAVVRAAPRPRADTPATCARLDRIAALSGFAPTTTLAEGIPRFAEWFKTWHAEPAEQDEEFMQRSVA